MRDVLHRTLIVRFSSIGDILLSTPLIRLLRQRFPGAEIDYAVKEEHAELLQGNPHLSRLLVLPGGAPFAALRSLRREVRTAGYDRIIDIHDSLRSRYLSAGAGPVVRVNKRKLARLLLVHWKLNAYAGLGGAPGVADRYLETVEDLGIRDDGMGLEVFPGPLHAERAARALAGVSGAAIGLAPGSRHWNKIWPQERFVEAAIQLVRRLRAAVLLFGSVADLERSGWIEQRIRAAVPGAAVVNLSGQLSLLETAAAMDRALVIITNDSGLMHLAAARKRPVVALFGPTVRELGFFPVGTRAAVLEVEDLRCRPCTHIGLSACPKDHFRCMLDIPPSRVVESAIRLLAE